MTEIITPKSWDEKITKLAIDRLNSLGNSDAKNLAI